VPPPRATALVSVPKVVDIARPATRATPAPQPDPPGTATPVLPTQVNGRAPHEDVREGDADGARPTVATSIATGLTCPVCGHSAAMRSRFCQHCGHIIGEAERRRVARQD
jgi:hypothetical protein